MEDLIKLGLPLYFVLYFGVAFVIKSLVVARRIGKNPLVLPKDDSAYGIIGLYFKLTLISMFIYTLWYSFFFGQKEIFLSISTLEIHELKITGILFLILAFIWTVVAQIHMSDSWRIGIDEATKTELVTTGLFAYSRNPIFLGMTMSLVGLFFVTPNGFTMLFLVLGYVLIQIQIRLEEEFLAREHGEVYTEYKKRTRRFI